MREDWRVPLVGLVTALGRDLDLDAGDFFFGAAFGFGEAFFLGVAFFFGAFFFGTASSASASASEEDMEMQARMQTEETQGYLEVTPPRVHGVAWSRARAAMVTMRRRMVTGFSCHRMTSTIRVASGSHSWEVTGASEQTVGPAPVPISMPAPMAARAVVRSAWGRHPHRRRARCAARLSSVYRLGAVRIHATMEGIDPPELQQRSARAIRRASEPRSSKSRGGARWSRNALPSVLRDPHRRDARRTTSRLSPRAVTPRHGRW
mmetsp:Transcript_14761/g.26103  ORF Transcript_14761/g.26103 Transcript_14761/m.26103 type:complete len:263 (+) Transcript_14761:130-918(+)